MGTRTPAPFTLPHFRAWTAALTLDNGQPWQLERFQAVFVRDVFAGYPECWLIIPEGNAKTTLVAALALYHTQFRDHARVPAAASSRDQAEWLYQAAAGFVERAGMESTFRCLEGYRRIRCDSMGSRLQIFAADDRTGDGVIPTLCLLDELHRHRNLNLYRTWRGKLSKRGGQIVAISTAGEPDGEFEEARALMRETATVTRRGAFTRMESDGLVVHEYAVPEDDQVDDLRAVKRANPLKAITVETLREKRRSKTMTPAHWRRFVCGLPNKDRAWIEPPTWDALRVDIGQVVPGEMVHAAVEDGVVVLAANRGDEAVAVRPFFVPPTYSATEGLVLRLAQEYQVRSFAYDRVTFQRSAELLADRGIPMVDVARSPERMAMASATLDRLVEGNLLRHDGDPELRRHVLRGVTKETERGWRFVKSHDTAALVAMAIAVHEASSGPPASIYEQRGLA